MSLVDKFENFKKNLASEKRARVTRRRDKIEDMAKSSMPTIFSGSTEKYRDGWDRIFAKRPDAAQDESRQ